MASTLWDDWRVTHFVCSRPPAGLPILVVALDELGDLIRVLLGQVVPAVLEDLDLHVGPAVMGSKVLGQSRHDRAEDVLAANKQ